MHQGGDMNINRSTRKAVRDFLVVAAGTVLLALAERAGDFGIPPESAPFVSAAALMLYRIIRGAAGREPSA